MFTPTAFHYHGAEDFPMDISLAYYSQMAFRILGRHQETVYNFSLVFSPTLHCEHVLIFRLSNETGTDVLPQGYSPQC